MSCDEFRGLLQDYVTRELEPEKRRQVDAHLLECDACQRELAILTAVVSSLGNQPVVEPSPDFASRVLGSLPRRQTWVPSPWLALLLVPVLGGVAYFARTAVASELSKLLGRLPHAPAQLPVPTAPQVALSAGVVVALGLLMSAGAAYYCWEMYLRD
jgi:anti-sigma factor RsiW